MFWHLFKTLYKRIQQKIWVSVFMNVYSAFIQTRKYKHFILTRSWTHLEEGQHSQDCIKIKIKWWREQQNHYILTVPQETQRSLFSQKTLNLAEPHSSDSNTDNRNPSWVQMGVQKTQAAALRSGRNCTFDRIMACLKLMIVTPYADGLTTSCWTRVHRGKASIW